MPGFVFRLGAGPQNGREIAKKKKKKTKVLGIRLYLLYGTLYPYSTLKHFTPVCITENQTK